MSSRSSANPDAIVEALQKERHLLEGKIGNVLAKLTASLPVGYLEHIANKRNQERKIQGQLEAAMTVAERLSRILTDEEKALRNVQAAMVEVQDARAVADSAHQGLPRVGATGTTDGLSEPDDPALVVQLVGSHDKPVQNDAFPCANRRPTGAISSKAQTVTGARVSNSILYDAKQRATRLERATFSLEG